MTLTKVPIPATDRNLPDPTECNTDADHTVTAESNILDALDSYLGSQIPNSRTARGYRRHIEIAIEDMGIESFAGISQAKLVGYRAGLMQDPRSDATHAQALVALRSFLRWACAMDVLALRWDTIHYLLPVPKYEVIKPHESLTEREVEKLIRAAGHMGQREHALVLVALGAGLRVSELVHVDIRDIYDDAGGGTVIHVRQGKGNKDRMMPVRAEVRQAIEDYLDATHRKMGDIGPLYMSQDRAMGDRDSWRLSTKTATKIIKAAVELAGIEKRVTPHALRHTFAFACYLYSKSPVAVQNLLGHSTINTTLRYINHLDRLDLRKSIPAYLGGGRGPSVRPSAKD